MRDKPCSIFAEQRSARNVAKWCGMVLVALLTLASPKVAAQGQFALHADDVVVFYGDSITDQRLYTTFVETFVVTRFPRLPVRFVHSGWGGTASPAAEAGPSIRASIAT